MEFSTNWITDYVDMPEGGVDEIAARLTAAGMAVEGRREVGDDVVLDIDVTTNRPDCMNHLGLARELAVLTGQELKPPSIEIDEDGSESATSIAAIQIDDFTFCPRFNALIVRGVEVGPSPEWLVDRLEAIGSRSINNIVDVTNYVMWELGQPMHAFDLHKIGKNGDGLHEIRVRTATEGEAHVTLDGVERTLDSTIHVLADPQSAVSLAGIMGGEESEVSEATTDLLLEAAHWNPTGIRKAAGKLGMHTDASHRFERGADPEACLWALRRAAKLMVELGGGRVVSGHIEVKKLASDWPPRVDLDLGRLNTFGGTELDASATERILQGLGFELQDQGEGSEVGGHAARWQVTAPSWRWYDFEAAHAQDVYEEVLRIYGFDNIRTTLPSLGAPDGRTGREHTLRRRVQDVLAAAGLAEAVNFAFHDAESDDGYPSLYGDRPAMLLANPLSERYSTMRRSLLPNLVDSARFNQRRNADAVRLFEIGHIFVAGKPGVMVGDEHDASDWGHEEMDVVAMVLGGRLGTPWEHQVALDFYDLKGMVEALAAEMGAEVSFRASELPKLRRGATAEILLGTAGANDQVIGYLGQLDDETDAFPLYAAEIALEPLGRQELELETRPPSRYPSIAVDSTLTHSKEVAWRELATAIESMATPDLVRFGLQDRYEGQGVPPGAVNTTIHFLYTAETRSLTQEEVNERHTALTAHLETRFGLR
ncbi:MAG: phenylalanine--tRNA ligase subunit beta [Thermoanaerobaculia bacterium]|nr:phenylalanine--tRNA ligase subunit beta [Thermoanaerobaculia bacterium]